MTQPEPTKPTEPDNPAAYALARHIADHPISTVQAAFRYLNAPITFHLHEDAPDASSNGLPPRSERCPDPNCADESQCWRCDYEESRARTTPDNPATSGDALREQYAAAIRAKIDGTEGCANGYRLADAVMAVRDAELREARAERDRSDETARRCLAQRQEMAAERYAWQERGDRAETALAMQKGISADLRVESRARGEKLAAAEAAIARVRAVQPYTARTHGDRSQGYRLGWNAARDDMHTALDDDAPADTTPPDPLADLHTWLTANAAHHRAAAPRCRIPEGFQAQDGMGAGLEIAARVVAGLIAGRGLPVSGGVKPVAAGE